MDNITRALSDLQDTSKRTLNRCNHLCSESTCKGLRTKTCSKVECELIRQEIKTLETRFAEIEKIASQNEDKNKTVSENINTVKHELDGIQTALHVNLETSNPNTVSSNKRLEHACNTQETVSGDRDSFVEQLADTTSTQYDDEDEHTLGAMGTTEYVGGIKSTQSNETHTIGAINKISTCTHCGVTSGTRNTAQKDTPAGQVKLVRQYEERKLFGTKHWSAIVEHEHNECVQLNHDLEGYNTILCVDISESMLENDGWEQASTFVTDFLNGLDMVGTTDEYVALVTFGHETMVKQRLTNNYKELLSVFGELKLGGPSCFYGGLLLSIMCVKCSNFFACRSNHEIVVPKRIIIITDGVPTDVNVVAGPDTITSCVEETKQLILNTLSPRSVMMNDIVFVPVGNSDTEFVQSMLDESGGLKFNYTDGKRLSRRSVLSKSAGVMQSLFMRRREIVTVEDQEDIFSIEIRSNRFSRIFDMLKRNALNEDCYHERVRSSLPTIGSRVRRGPDWVWNKEDGCGIGTIVGHAKDADDVWVLWDNDRMIRFYRYGESGHYDVLIDDEPRELHDGRRLAVGCNVRPGNSWKQSEYKPRQGVVVKIETDMATVRWDNGQRGEFSADLEKGELEYYRILKGIRMTLMTTIQRSIDAAVDS